MSERKRKWEMLASDDEFLQLFTDSRIVEATTSSPDDANYIGADIYWRFASGAWLAMEVSTSPGCDTCGYGAGEKTYWTLPPSPETQP